MSGPSITRVVKYIRQGEAGKTPQPNLVDGTGFVRNLDAWTIRQGFAASDYLLNGQKCFYADSNESGATNLDFLRQELWTADGSVHRISAGKWYTLSFYMAGWRGAADLLYTYLFHDGGGIVDTSAGCYVDGVSQTASGDGYVSWKTSDAITDSPDWIKRTYTFKTVSDLGSKTAYLLFRLPPGARDLRVSCIKLEEGTEATPWQLSENDRTGNTGPAMRGPQAWSDCAVGYEFQAGGDTDEWKDVVLYDGNYYTCIKTHTKAANNYPLSTLDTANGYWKLGDKIELVATKILLATYALVENLGVTAIDMKDADGNILFQAKDGNVVCKTGTFENVRIKGYLYSTFVNVASSDAVLQSSGEYLINTQLNLDITHYTVILPSGSEYEGARCLLRDSYYRVVKSVVTNTVIQAPDSGYIIAGDLTENDEETAPGKYKIEKLTFRRGIVELVMMAVPESIADDGTVTEYSYQWVVVSHSCGSIEFTYKS